MFVVFFCFSRQMSGQYFQTDCGQLLPSPYIIANHDVFPPHPMLRLLQFNSVARWLTSCRLCSVELCFSEILTECETKGNRTVRSRDNWALLDYYEASRGISYRHFGTTYRSDLISNNFILACQQEITTTRCVIAQKSAVIIQFAAEAWNNPETLMKYGEEVFVVQYILQKGTRQQACFWFSCAHPLCPSNALRHWTEVPTGNLPSIQTCVTQRERLLASRRSFKRPNGEVVRPWLRRGSDRTVGRNYWSAATSRSLPLVHCRGKSPRSPKAQGGGWGQNWYADAAKDSSLLGVD
jgi:hypothetical protein